MTDPSAVTPKVTRSAPERGSTLSPGAMVGARVEIACWARRKSVIADIRV